MINTPLTGVTEKKDVSYDALNGILERWIASRVDWDTLEAFAIMGIDAIALLKGHRNCVAVISTQTERGYLHVLAVLCDQEKAPVVMWRQTIPAAIRARIMTICPDGTSAPYKWYSPLRHS